MAGGVVVVVCANVSSLSKQCKCQAAASEKETLLE